MADVDPRPRLLAGAAVATAGSLAVTIGALLVRDASGAVVRADLAILRVTTGWAAASDGLRRAAEVGSTVLHPYSFRAVVLALALVLARRGARRAALWAATTIVVGSLLSGG